MAARKIGKPITSTNYTRVLQATNMDVVEELGDAQTDHYACELLGQRNMMNLPVKNVVKVYLDPKKT